MQTWRYLLWISCLSSSSGDDILAPKEDQLCLLVGTFLLARLARRFEVVPPIFEVLQMLIPSFRSLPECEPSLSLRAEHRLRHSWDAAGVRSFTWIFTLKDSINVESRERELEDNDVLRCWIFLMVIAAPSKLTLVSSPIIKK